MEIELAKLPMMTGAPGRTSWANAIPASASARVWVITPTGVTGAMGKYARLVSSASQGAVTFA